jgi:signal transduction histidine kinase/ligand-binding sensor domain-containing protein
LACVASASANDGVPQPVTASFTVQRWTREEGLPQNSVKTICLGSDGLLWGAAGTQLWRFDGVRFAEGPAIDEPRSFSRGIFRVLVDGLGRLTVIRRGAVGLVYEDGWRKLPEWDYRRLRQLYDVAVASNRLVCLTDVAVGLSAQEGWRLAAVEPAASENVNWRKASCGADGTVWIAAQGGLYRLVGERCVRVPVPPASEDLAYESVHVGASGDVWVYRHPGDFFRFSRGAWAALPPVPKLAQKRLGITAMVERRPGELWAGGQHGLYRWDGVRWNALYTGEGLYPPAINDLCVDARGRVWAGSEGGGLLCFRERVVDMVRVAQGPAVQAFTALHECGDGTLLAGIAGSGLWRGSLDKGFEPVASETFSAQATVFSVCDDGSGGLWLGALGHHLMRRAASGQTQVIYPGRRVPFMDAGVRALLRARDGKLWVGTQRGVMVYAEPDGLDWPKHQIPNTVNALAEGAGARVWAASESEGVLVFEGKSLAWTAANEGLPAPLPCVETVYADSEERLWCGGSFGLAWHDGARWRPVAMSLLEGTRVVMVLEDDAGHLWLGTDKGIVRLNRSALLGARGTEPADAELALRKEDGLDDEHCSGGFSPAGLRMADGRLLFPTRNGLAVVTPSAVVAPLQTAPVYVDQVVTEDGRFLWRRAFGPRAAAGPSTVSVPAGARSVTVRWLTAEPGSGRTARFRAVLEGSGYRRAGDTVLREAAYDNLAPGSYRFTLSVQNRTSCWTSAAEVLLTVQPYWWQRASARALFAVALLAGVGGLGWWGARRRARRLRKTDALRLRIARDLHDEIGANLGGVALLLDLAGSQGDAESFERIRSIVTQSIGTLKDLVWMIDPAHDNASDLVARVKEAAAMLLPATPYSVRVEGDGGEMRVSTAVRRNVLPIIKESLHNVVKHAHASRADVLIARHGRRLKLVVEDDGDGFDEGEMKAGHGVRNMRRRAEEMQALFLIERRAEGGTRVTLDVPLTKD